MKRNITLQEISDGKLYRMDDMVRADCGGCNGCSVCCHGMGESIILTPWDIFQISRGTKASFGELMVDKVELNLADGLILPNLKMGGADAACGFLNENGRCSIHPYRPDICRLFPLGRNYGSEGIRYFLQTHECPKPGRSKIRVRKWLDIPDIRTYEKFILDWHDYLESCREDIQKNWNEEKHREKTMWILKQFYIRPYETEDFYGQFYERLAEAWRL